MNHAKAKHDSLCFVRIQLQCYFIAILVRRPLHWKERYVINLNNYYVAEYGINVTCEFIRKLSSIDI